VKPEAIARLVLAGNGRIEVRGTNVVAVQEDGRELQVVYYGNSQRDAAKEARRLGGKIGDRMMLEALIEALQIAAIAFIAALMFQAFKRGGF
jgi:2-phospho-L-lactate guanylyltransferase (CobY/MobA/RfbA family)